MVYLWSAIAVGIGTLMIVYTEWLVANFGRVAWAEEHLSTEGGTRAFYKVLGVIIILAAFLAVTGDLGLLLGKLFTPASSPS